MADATTTSILRPLVEDLAARREQIKLAGGEEKIARQHEREKLTARERLALLIDEGTFVEMGIHGRPHSSQRAMDGVEAPADGVITGYGKVDGRLVAVCAYDFTALAGSHLVRAAVGEDVTQEELGGSRVHCRKSGVGDMEVASDEECIQRIKEYLSFMPQNCEAPVPVRAVRDPIERAEEELLDVL